MALTRLDKAVSHLTGLTRKQAFKLIREGRVSVEDLVLTDAACKIDENAEIVIDEDSIGTAAEAETLRYFMVNKPLDTLCADHDRNSAVVMDLFREELNSESLHCAGRLDKDTTGLIIVTDDGAFIHDITSPRKEIPKTYVAVVDGVLSDSMVERFASGLKHPEEKKPYRPALLKILNEHEAEVTVTEGRFHEVKRLFECCGLNVTSLKRIAIGGLTLDDTLDEGEFRQLDENELEQIFEGAD